MQRGEQLGGAEGNARLTGYVAVILLVPLALGSISLRVIPYYTDPPLSGGG